MAVGQQVPDPPRPVFARATDTDRATALAAVRAALLNPADPLRSHAVTLPPAPLDADELDTDRLRRRLLRAREHGFVLPTGVENHINKFGQRFDKLVYDRTACGIAVTDATRSQVATITLAIAGCAFLVVLVISGVIAAAINGGGVVDSAGWVLLSAGGAAAAAAGTFMCHDWRLLRYGLDGTDIEDLFDAMRARRDRHTADVTSGDREVALASIAATQIHAITTSAAWDSGYLDLGRAVLDPDAELAEIRTFAGELHTMRSRLGTAPTGNSLAAAQARAHHAERRSELDTVFDSLVERVAALHHYANVLAALSDTITALDSIEQSRAAGDDIATLAAQLGANDLATDRYDRLTADATALRAEITHFTHTLTGIAP